MICTDDLTTRDDPASVRTRRECRLWLCPRKNPRPERVAWAQEKSPVIVCKTTTGPTVRAPFPRSFPHDFTMPRERVNLSRR